MEQFRQALLYAKLSVILGLVAFSYFFFLKLTMYLRKKAWAANVVPVTQKLITICRSVHVYAGITAGAAAFIHAYIMVSIFLMAGGTPGGILYSGITTLAVFILVISLGIALFRNRSNLRLRYRHRYAVLVLGTALIIHQLIK